VPGVDLATYKARRPRRDQASLFVLAFVVSVLLHVLAVVAWEYRAHLPQLAWLDWLKSQATKLNPAELLLKLDEPKPLPPELEQIAAARPPPPEEPPLPQLTFVDVDPALAAEPPKDAKFYSTVSTKAANPDTTVESNVPKIDGKQEQFAKVTEVTKPLPPALPPPAPQPKAPAPPPEAKTTPEPKPQPPPTPTPKATPPPTPQPPPKPVVKPQPTPPKKVEPQPLQPTPPPAPKPAGDTLPKPKAPPTPPPPAPAPTQVAKNTTDFLNSPTMNPSAARPTPPPEPGDADTKISRPRTIKEALARRQESGIVGEKMKQEGGVRNLGVSALDVRGMSFGAYDAAIIQAIQQRWYSLLESRPTPRGKVILEFRLHFDGRVTDMKVNDADVGELYSLFCQKAVQDPAPFPRWPSDMRRQLQADHRDVRFTFFYN